MLIGRLVVRLECQLPERADANWAWLRYLGSRPGPAGHRGHAVSAADRRLLGSCRPAALSAGGQAAGLKTWLSCLAAVIAAGADLAPLAAGGVDSIHRRRPEQLHSASAIPGTFRTMIKTTFAGRGRGNMR
ncbi:MAG TPA: hypothetical protein VH561_13695 [Micromonosporaceae bacterium]